MKATRLKRRSFLGWLVSTGVPACASFSLPVTASTSKSVHCNSSHRYEHSAETDQLGQYYLSEFPEDVSACRHLLTLISNRRDEYTDKDSRLWRGINKKICDDFRQDNTVNLYGWVLSKTELRLATLNILVDLKSA
jgi:hypothetical protein